MRNKIERVLDDTPLSYVMSEVRLLNNWLYFIDIANSRIRIS